MSCDPNPDAAGSLLLSISTSGARDLGRFKRLSYSTLCPKKLVQCRQRAMS